MRVRRQLRSASADKSLSDAIEELGRVSESLNQCIVKIEQIYEMSKCILGVKSERGVVDHEYLARKWKLSTGESKIILLLYERRSSVSESEMLKLMMDHDIVKRPTINSLRVMLHKIRLKIGNPSIVNIRGHGYFLHQSIRSHIDLDNGTLQV